MEKSNILKQAKSDIFKELYNIIKFYIEKGANAASLRKYYKNNHRFNDLLEDIRNKGINLVKDETEYKKIVKDTLDDILLDFISKDKDNKSKLKHIKEFYSFNSDKDTIKNEIKYLIFEIEVDLDKYYNNDGDKEYSVIINEISKNNTSAKLTKLMMSVLFINEEDYENHYSEINSFLSELKIVDEQELDEKSVDDVTDEIYYYMTDYSDHDLENKFKIFKDIKEYNL